VVGVDRLLVRGGIVVDQFGVDADLGQRLTQIVAELFRFVEVRRRQQLQAKRLPSAVALVAGLVQQRVGLGDVERVLRHVGGIELRSFFGTGRWQPRRSRGRSS
jgi:hypothetical protein